MTETFVPLRASGTWCVKNPDCVGEDWSLGTPMSKIGVRYPFLLDWVPEPAGIFIVLLETIAHLWISVLVRFVLLLVCYGL